MNYLFQTLLTHLGVENVDGFLLDPFQSGSLNFDVCDKSTEESSVNSVPETEVKVPKKSVRFHNKIKVILVPMASEYHDAGCDLWWKDNDYVKMREDFRAEIDLALKCDESLHNDVYAAMTKLYQPEITANRPPAPLRTRDSMRSINAEEILASHSILFPPTENIKTELSPKHAAQGKRIHNQNLHHTATVSLRKESSQ